SWPISDQPFADVSGWYSHYMSYGKDMGLINGVGGSNNYNPDGNVTGVEYAILLLRQMGMDNEAGDRYTGASWRTNALADAAKVGLFEGLEGVSYTAGALTREEACQMALNALLYSPNGDRTDFVVTAKAKEGEETKELYKGTNETAAYLVYAQALGATEVYASAEITEETTNVDSLGQKAYGLTFTKATDTLGRTAVSYTAPQYKLELLDVSGADYTFEGKVTNAALYAAVGKDVAGYNTWTVKVDGVENKEFSKKPVKDISDAYAGTAPGTVTEVYVHDKSVDVLVSKCYMGTVSKAVEAKGDSKAYVMVNGMKYETEAFEKDDTVLFTKEANKIVSMTLAPEVTGTLTRIVNGGTFTIDGKSYVKSGEGKLDGFAQKLGKSVTFYTDTQGNIMALKDGVTSGANTYIYVAAHSAAKDNPDYITSTTYPQSIEVYGVTSDGEVVKKNVLQIGDDKVGDENLKDFVANSEDAKIVGLYMIADTEGDSLILSEKIETKANGGITVNNPAVEDKDGNKAVANSETAFIFISMKGGDDKTITNVTVKTGIANIGTNIGEDAATLAVDGVTVEAVFVLAAFEDENSDAVGVVYVKGGTEKKIDAWEDGKAATWYTYDCVDEAGDKVTLTSKVSLAGAKGEVPYAGAIYEYDEEGFLIGKVDRAVSDTLVEVRKGSTIKVKEEGKAFNKTGETNVVFIDGEGVDVEAGDVVTLVPVSASEKKQYDVQVVFVTGKGKSDPVIVAPNKPTEGDDKNKVIVEVGAGESFTVEGEEEPDKIVIPGLGAIEIDKGDYGKVDEVRSFTFKGTKDEKQKYTLTILDADGALMYKEELEALKGGAFWVQLVNLTDGQTAVSNSGENGADKDGTLAGTEGKELDIGKYSWSITGEDESVAANGSFDVTYNGNNTAKKG
ncbi:MAG: hypothetical protein NC131_21305, partial [Roseburia sp.]|nr:hypothetical protein [Roseburia sp.]